MTNELKNVPELRFPEFEGEWEEKRLKDISKINPKYEDSFPSEFNYIDLESVKKGKIYKISRYTMHNAPSRAQRVAKQGDIFFQTVRPYQQNNFVFVDDSYPTVVSTGYAQLRSNLNPSYLDNLLLTTSFLNKVLVKCTGSNYPAINSSDLSNIQLKITSNINEQQKIGEFFSKLDQQIELEEKKLAKLEEQKKGYMQKIFSQEIRFKDDNGNDYPEWESKKFLDIFKLAPSKNNQIKSSEVVENGIIPVVDQGKDIFLGYSNEKDKAIEDFDNVIVYGDHTTIIKYIKEPFIIGGDGVKLLESNDGSLIHYLYILLQYFNVKPEGYKRHYSILKNKMMNISNTKEEQEKIGDFFNELDELIEKQSSKIVVLKQRKKGFLQKMFV